MIMSKQGAAPHSRPLLDVRGAAEFLGVSAWTVRTLIWRGDLVHVRVGRLVRVTVEDLEAFVEQNRLINGQPPTAKVQQKRLAIPISTSG